MRTERFFTRKWTGALLLSSLLLFGRAGLAFVTETPAPGAAAVADAVLNPAKLADMDRAVDEAIAAHEMPGGVLWLEHKGARYEKAYGNRALIPKVEAMTEDTIFDAASLTKVLATTPCVMLLWERGKIKLDEPVASYLPEFRAHGKESITVRHLMTHTSGLSAGLGRNPDWSGYDKAIALACAEKPTHPPSVLFRYSDINFIVLGELVRRISGRELNDFASSEVFGPLKMVDTMYLPPRSLVGRIAPTERVEDTVLRGIVHDPTAQRMGGVAGHAGVFTSVADVARYARMFLNNGELEGVQLFKPDTVRLMTSVQSPSTVPARRGLGWDIDSDYSRPRGSVFPLGSYGHTGFTGVCLWIDPFSQSFWMLFANRVHPDRSGNVLPLQRTLANLSGEAITDFDFVDVPGALSPRTNAPTSSRPGIQPTARPAANVN